MSNESQCILLRVFLYWCHNRHLVYLSRHNFGVSGIFCLIYCLFHPKHYYSSQSRAVSLSPAEVSRERKGKRKREKTGCALDNGKSEESFLPPSQRSPLAHLSFPQSSNIFTAFSCSSPPLKSPKEPLWRREGLY